MLDMEGEQVLKQVAKKNYDWLKPTQFKPGQSGNPNGRPKGPTLKTWLKARFEEMNDEERIEFLNQVDPIKAWEMSEGKAESKTDITSGGQPLQVLVPQAVAETFNLNADTNTETGGVSTEQK